MQLKENIFWDWFKANNQRFIHIDYLKSNSEKELLQHELLAQLSAYCDSLSFEITGENNGEKKLVISAGADKAYFNQVENLVAAAPALPNWEVIAFKQAKNADFVLDYLDLRIDVAKLWFLPLDFEASPQLLGLRVYIENYEEDKIEQFLPAILEVLAAVLGEKCYALDVYDVTLALLPPDPIQEELIEFADLKEYIDWRKAKIAEEEAGVS